MPDGTAVGAAECRDTQLHTIRDLMFSAARRGAWLTLGEIAGLTEFGEASISAQLRHLRKWRHGGHRVEKRRRFMHSMEVGVKWRRGEIAGMWEYRVLPPESCETPAGAERQETDQSTTVCAVETRDCSAAACSELPAEVETPLAPWTTPDGCALEEQSHAKARD